MTLAPLARLLIAAALLATGCAAKPPPQVDRLELTGGWGLADGSLTVHLQRDGKGIFEAMDLNAIPLKKTGSFTISPERFAGIVVELETARRDARPISDIDFALEPCTASDRVSDAGGFYIHWTGPGLDQHVSYNFGCDYKRHKERNARLDAILNGLPIPRPKDAG
ncbi:MAG: hypothetical protein ACAH11_02700 [Sphingomonas sp.]